MNRKGILSEPHAVAGGSIRRRHFLKGAAASAAVVAVLPRHRGLGANDRVRLGVIGFGARGQEDVREALKLGNVEFVAAADVYNRRHGEAKQLNPGVRVFTDHRRLLDLKDIDGVVVASPLHCHARHFLDTISAGKDLYSEKTMTWSIQEAEACRDAARKSDRVIQIGLQHQSSGPLFDTKQWIKDGMLGKITHVESWMSRNTPRGKGQWVRPVPVDCTAANVDWNLFLNGRPSRSFDAYKFINWRLYWEFSGGNVTENMVHQIGLIMRSLDLPLPTSAYMSGGVFSEKDGREVPDTIAVTLDFPNDLTVTWHAPKGFRLMDMNLMSNQPVPVRSQQVTVALYSATSTQLSSGPATTDGSGKVSVADNALATSVTITDRFGNSTNIQIQ